MYFATVAWLTSVPRVKLAVDPRGMGLAMEFVKSDESSDGRSN
jgi:hypothetical protein